MKKESKEVMLANDIATALADGEKEGGVYLIMSSPTALDIAYFLKDADDLSKLITSLQDRYAELVKLNMEKTV